MSSRCRCFQFCLPSSELEIDLKKHSNREYYPSRNKGWIGIVTSLTRIWKDHRPKETHLVSNAFPAWRWRGLTFVTVCLGHNPVSILSNIIEQNEIIDDIRTNAEKMFLVGSEGSRLSISGMFVGQWNSALKRDR